jgi:hypothetical protein
MIRLAGLFACTGVAISLLLIVAWKVSAASQLWTISDAVTRLMLVLWPTSFGLMALHRGSTTSDVILVYTALILANAVLYSVVGTIVAALVKVVRRSS